MKNYKVNNNASIDGTSLKGEVVLSYANLLRKFGEPAEGDGYKVSTQYSFESESGEVFTIYDWKSTDLYDEGLPSVDAFRKERNYEWHVGSQSNTDVKTFINWILRECSK